MKPNHVATPNTKKERATDADRESTVDVLGDAFARGSLAAAEHEERLSSALSARHVWELTSLTSDLPNPTNADMVHAQRASDLVEWLQEWRWWLGGAVIMSSIWGVQAIAAGPGFFWPLVPLGVWAAILVAVVIWPREEDR